MRTLIVGVLSAGTLVAFASAGSAGNNDGGKHRRHQERYYSNPSSSTERQQRNLRAYERGEYYEHDSNALPVGSRAWWEQKERESGGDNRH